MRFLTLIAAALGLYYLEFKWSFPYWDVVLEPYGHALFWAWGNFDGVHYLRLAQEGYNFGLTQAFFPMYMLMIRYISLIIPNMLLVGLGLSHIFFILSLWIFYKLVRLDYSKTIAKRTLLLYTLFPTSFYFLSLYTESLFMFLLFSIFYLWRKKQWMAAGLLGILLTATRIVGIFIVPALLLELYLQKKSTSQSIAKQINLKITISHYQVLITNYIKPQISNLITHYWKILAALIPSLGLLTYMLYLYIRFDDPLLFANVQSDFGAGRETGKFILLYQVIWRYVKMVVTVDRSNPLYFTIILEFISSITVISLIVWGFFKKIRPSYLVFSLCALILPTLTGTFSSMPRYVLVAFPAFIILAQIKNSKIFYSILSVSTILLIICTAMFTRGYWIS